MNAINKLLTGIGTCLSAVAASMVGQAETLGTYYLSSSGMEAWVTDYTEWKLGSTSGASATEDVNPNYDYVYNGSKRMKGPLASSGYAAYTFDGHSLILDCNNVNAGFLLQNDQDQTITFANEGLIFRRNAYLGSWNGGNADIYGKITVNSGVQMGIYESGAHGKAFVFHDKFYGSGTVHVYSILDDSYGNEREFTANFSDGVLSAFAGTIKVSWGQRYTSSAYTSASKAIIGLNGGTFQGAVEVAVGGVLKSAGTNTIGNLTLKAGSTLDFADQPTSESEPVLSVSDALTVEDAVDVKLPAADETFEQILAAISESASGRYTMQARRGILLRAPAGTTPDAEKFVLGAGLNVDPVVPDIKAEFDGRDLKYGPDLKYYVLGSGFADNKNGTGTADDDMTNVVKWSDGQAPDDPDTGYILNAKFIRNPNRYSTGSEAHRDIFAGGALITSGSCTLIEQDSGFVCDDLRIMSGALLVRDINANGWVDKFWSNDFTSYAADGAERAVTCSKAVSFEGHYGIASGATLTLSQYALTNPAWDMRANLYGNGTVQTSMGSQTKSGTAFQYGSSVFRFSGDNSKFGGKILINSSVYSEDCRTHAYFTRKEAFGGGRATPTVNAVQFDRNTVLHIPSNSVIAVDQSNLGFYLGGNPAAKPQGNRGFVEFDIGTNSVFALEEQLTFNNALKKTGPGTFALGGSLKFQTAKSTYSDTPVAGVTDGTNVLTIAEGVFRPLASTAVDGLEVRFEEGAGLEIEVTDDIADGIGRYGMVNTWSTPFVLPEGGIMVTVTDPGYKLKRLPKALRKVAIATLSMDKASALRGKMTCVMAAGPRYSRAVIKESDNGDGTVTFYAVPQGPGFIVSFH